VQAFLHAGKVERIVATSYLRLQHAVANNIFQANTSIYYTSVIPIASRYTSRNHSHERCHGQEV